MSKAAVAGVWLRRSVLNGGRLEVLVELDGRWRRAIDEADDGGPISRIADTAAILVGLLDDLPDAVPYPKAGP